MKMSEDFKIRFWGVRGSHPVPGKSTTRYGGNTPCVEIQAGEHTIILDAGTGIIDFGQELVQHYGGTHTPIHATLLFTHLHHDHTQGLPFFVPAYLPTTRLNIFVPDIYEKPAEDALVSIMASPTFPVPFHSLKADKNIYGLRENEIIRLGISKHDVQVYSANSPVPPEDAVWIRCLQSYAHPQGVMIYRITWQGKSIVYATDTEGYVGGDRRLINFARGCDLLIHDAQYSADHYLGRLTGAPITQGFGHSTTAMACEIAQSADIGQLILFHHDPNYDDATISKLESQARAMFPGTVAAREGQEIDLQERVIAPKARDAIYVVNLFKEEGIARSLVPG